MHKATSRSTTNPLILPMALFNQLVQPVAIVELVCILLTLPTTLNVVLGLSLESGGLASRAWPPGITYQMTCSTALTQIYLRKRDILG